MVGKSVVFNSTRFLGRKKRLWKIFAASSQQIIATDAGEQSHSFRPVEMSVVLRTAL